MEAPFSKSHSAVRHSEGGFPSINLFILVYQDFFNGLNSNVFKLLRAIVEFCSPTLCFLQETTFIEQVVEDERQMEGTPPGCSKILNWHLHLNTRNLAYPRGWLLQKHLDTVLPIN